MATDLYTIKQKWNDLLEGEAGSSMAARYLLAGPAKLRIYLVIRYPEKTPAIEIGPIPPDVYKGTIFPQLKGIETHLTSDTSDCFLAADLNQTGAADVFLILAARLCEALQYVSTPITACGIVSKELKHWQKFFAPNRQILTRSQQVGLAGELIFMLQLIENGLDASDILKAWQGTEKSHHDFHFEKCSVEIKTTTSSNLDCVNITSLRQLERVGTKELYLTQLALDQHDNEEQQLFQLVNSFKELLTSSYLDQVVFAEKLINIGYREQDISQYETCGYTLRKSRIFTIDEHFPCLTTKKIPPEIVEVSYKLSLTGMSKNTMSSKQLFELISGKNYE
ncbi:PD-(D/E)XK motif protein [uncultured Neptuniibacter sp.]|uniref:PD-(D/E)XK motif protein n=1 Tax=uncultured Neptuniibacter sp. TaxID=502143 RepID=UPI00260744F9|nr:PD-(D/E)XK motif protein [uncultured Neptuniibacter sp.]